MFLHVCDWSGVAGYSRHDSSLQGFILTISLRSMHDQVATTGVDFLSLRNLPISFRLFFNAGNKTALPRDLARPGRWSVSMQTTFSESLLTTFHRQHPRRCSQAHSDALGIILRLQLDIPIIKVPHDESSNRCSSTEPSRDIVAGDNVRLLVGWEGEDRNPGGEDVSECVHLESFPH